jgi:MprA protease rhombosortase-interaction domain-containing protein
VVDSQDYSVWRIAFGTKTLPIADGNHNGIIDAADYTVWRDHVGQSALNGATANLTAMVPEPSAAALLIVSGLAGFRTRRR